MKHVIVIGGGIAGMQCAVELARGDVRVTLLEKLNDTGGKVRNWHKLRGVGGDAAAGAPLFGRGSGV